MKSQVAKLVSAVVCVPVLVICFTTGVLAQTENLPKAVQDAIKEDIKSCQPEKAKLLDGFVTQCDVNGDGVADFLLDYGRFECGGSSSFFCGSVGCLQQLFVSMKDGSFKAVPLGNVHDINFVTVRARPAIVLDLHGSACRKVGSALCRKTLVWNGNTFKLGHKARTVLRNGRTQPPFG